MAQSDTHIDSKSAFTSIDGQKYMRLFPKDMNSALIALSKTEYVDGIPSVVAIEDNCLVLTTLQDGTTDVSPMDVHQTRLVLNRLLDILIELEKIGVTNISLVEDGVLVSQCDHSVMVYGIANAIFDGEHNDLNIEYARFAQHIAAGKNEPPSIF